MPPRPHTLLPRAHPTTTRIRASVISLGFLFAILVCNMTNRLTCGPRQSRALIHTHDPLLALALAAALEGADLISELHTFIAYAGFHR